MYSRRVLFSLALSAVLCGLVVSLGWAQSNRTEDPPLPTEVPIVVEAQASETFKIGIADLLGPADQGREAAGIMRRDFMLFPGYTVVGPSDVRHDLAAEGMGIDTSRWAALDVRGVIKGRIDGNSVEMRFYRVTSSAPSLTHTYSGGRSEHRKFMHDFGNKVLEHLTGKAGPFGTKLTFAKRQGPGKKDIYVSDMDGFGAGKLSGGGGVNMLPAFDSSGRVWFTRLTPTGTYITHNRANNRRVISGDGLNMAPSVCGGRVYFSSSRSGNSEIYSARLDGSDLKRLTTHNAIDVSPACGPRGQVAFVSSRHGSPQIWTMNADGSNQRRVTYRGSHNQTPAICQDPSQPLIAFTGRDGNLDVFIVNYQTQEYTRVTQGQGNNKDPAFSPDCRMISFVSDRRGAPGVYVSSPEGFNQQLVHSGSAETVRWAQ